MNVKRLLKAGIAYLADPDYRFLINAGYGLYDNMPDEEYLKRKFKAIMGKELDLETPKTFNEKLQWLKLYDRRPEYTMMSDKYAVRAYIAEMLGEEYLIPSLGVWDDPEEIDFDALPNQFVLKCNHNSGLGMCICTDKSKLDIAKVKAELKKGLAQDYYLTGREWPYRDIPRKIVAEKYMGDGKNDFLIDYKFFCFNGEPRFMYVCREEHEGTKPRLNHMNMNWEKLPFGRDDVVEFEEQPPKPENFEKMIEFSKKLSADTPFVRVDFYEISGQLYFGELTFYTGSGYVNYNPPEWDEKIGRWLELPEKM